MSSELEKNYKKAFNKKLGFGKNPALILVDFVSAYFDVWLQVKSKQVPVGQRHQIGSEERKIKTAAGVDHEIEHRCSGTGFNTGTAHLAQLFG